MDKGQQLINRYNEKFAELQGLYSEREVFESNYVYEKTYAPDGYMKNNYLASLNRKGIKLQNRIDSLEKELRVLKSKIDNLS